MAEFKGGSFKGELAFSLAQKRELEREEFERRKEKIALENESHVANFNNKFSSTYESIGDQLINDTVGLVTRDEFARKREKILQEREQILAKAKLDENLKANSKSKKPKKKKLKTSTLSFDFEEDDPGSEKEQQSEEASVPLIKTVKNPAVDTSFLPDKTRELEERRLREELRQEWLRQQEIIKKEEIEITYSYWDGSGHRKTLMAKKGNTIGEFLQKALETLRAEFFELKHASTESVMYIKEDLIIPQHYTFYDFIINKARGKSGPLFNFDVHEDIRLVANANLEKDESHAGKICLRSWYERNKHIFPASRWEPYDPQKSWSQYTIKDKKH